MIASLRSFGKGENLCICLAATVRLPGDNCARLTDCVFLRGPLGSAAQLSRGGETL